MDDQQLERYSRHIMLPELDYVGQQNITQGKVVIFGAGGLGCAAASYLAAAGVEQLTLVDPDRVELSNLARQISYTEQDIGQFKARVLAQRLAANNTGGQYQVLCQRMALPELEQLLLDYDLVLDATDNFSARDAINRACVSTSTPLVSGAAIRWQGQVAVFNLSAASACYHCLYASLATYAEGCNESGVFSPLVGVVGSLQAGEALKILAQRPVSLDSRLLLIDQQSTEFRSLTLPRDPACPVCGERHTS